MREGIDVRGYFTWTLMDNYEWNHGMKTRMGLYAVDSANAAKPRRAREAVGIYAVITKARDVPAALEERYRSVFP